MESLLHLKGKAAHPAAHVRVPVGQPHPHARRHRDHRRTAVITRRKATKPTSAPTRMQVPSGSAISIQAASASAALFEVGQGDERARRSGDGVSAVTCTGTNTGIGSGASTPSRT